MNTDDITDLMESADPVDTSEVQGWVESPEGQRILAGILAEGIPARRDRRRLILPPVVALLLLAVGGSTYLLTSSAPTTDPSAVGCYSALDASADTALFPIRAGEEELGPAGICAKHWPHTFGEPSPKSLVTCIVAGGGTGVFPNPERLSPDEACGSIGASLPEEATYGGLSQAQVRELRRDIGSRVAGLYQEPDCAPAGPLLASLQDFVRERDLAAWNVVDETSPTQRWTFPDGTSKSVAVPRTAGGERCAAHVIDPVAARILLVNGWPRLPEA